MEAPTTDISYLLGQFTVAFLLSGVAMFASHRVVTATSAFSEKRRAAAAVVACALSAVGLLACSRNMLTPVALLIWLGLYLVSIARNQNGSPRTLLALFLATGIVFSHSAGALAQKKPAPARPEAGRGTSLV